MRRLCRYSTHMIGYKGSSLCSGSSLFEAIGNVGNDKFYNRVPSLLKNRSLIRGCYQNIVRFKKYFEGGEVSGSNPLLAQAN